MDLMKICQILRLLSLRNTLRSRSSWSHEELVAYQTQALRELRDYAYKNSPFYQQHHKGLWDRPLHELPVLMKTEFVKHWDDIVTDRSIKLSEVQEFLAHYPERKLLKDKYYCVSTSGSSGQRASFIYDSNEWLQVLASYARANDWAGVKAGLTHRLKVAVVSTTAPWHQSALVGATLKSWFVPTKRLDSTAPMRSIAQQLNQFQPRSLVAYAGMAKELALEQIAGNLAIHPEAVFCASEVLTNDARRIIHKAWNVEPFNVYAATETAGIASECCEHKDLHIYEDLVIIEVVDRDFKPVKPGEYGEYLLATVLFSRTLPLIRYVLDDSVCLNEAHQCSCGLPFRTIGDVQGRSEEILYLKDEAGNSVRIHPNVFHDIMEKQPVTAWQIEQAEWNNIDVLVKDPLEGFSEKTLIQSVSSALESQRIAKPRIKVRYMKLRSRTSTGKVVLVRASRLPHQENAGAGKI